MSPAARAICLWSCKNPARRKSSARIFAARCSPSRVKKIEKNQTSIPYVEADGMNLSFADGTFDAVTIAFGLRNFSNWHDGLKELHRVLKPNGKLAILEFSTPVIPGFRQIFNLYFTQILPRIGGAVTGSRGAYEYLPNSVSRFPDQKNLARNDGRNRLFESIEYKNLTGGIAAIAFGREKVITIFKGFSPIFPMKYKILNFARRLALLLLVVWTVVSLVTLLIILIPGRPAIAILGENATGTQIEQFKRKHGLDKPRFFHLGRIVFNDAFASEIKWHGFDNRYVELFRRAAARRFGKIVSHRPTGFGYDLERYPNTIKLALAAMLVAISIAIPLGVLAGTNKGSLIDNFSSFFALARNQPAGFCHRTVFSLFVRRQIQLVCADRQRQSGRHRFARRHFRRGAFGDFDANGALVR